MWNARRLLLPLFVLAALAALAPSRLPAQDGTWTLLPPMPVANAELGAATLGSRIYCVGGFLAENHRRLLIHQPSNGAWLAGADAPHEIHHAGVVAFGGKLFVFGGGHQESDHVQIYDPARDRWSEGAPMPTPRTAAAAVVAGGLIHVLGGSRAIVVGNATTAHEVYDPATDSWSERAPLPVKSEHVFAGLLGGRIYVIGGRSSLVNLDATQIYDPATDSWSLGARLPVATSGMALQVFRDRLWVFGGENLVSREVVTAVQRYDPAADRWEVLGDLPVAVHGVASAVHGDAIYLFGGSERAGSGAGVTAVQRLAFAPLPSGGKPARPTKLTAKPAGPGAAALAWRDNARNEIEYVVEVRPPGAKGFSAAATLPAGTAAVTLQGFERAGVYRFRVVAVSSTHRSAPSNVVQARLGAG